MIEGKLSEDKTIRLLGDKIFIFSVKDPDTDMILTIEEAIKLREILNKYKLERLDGEIL